MYIYIYTHTCIWDILDNNAVVGYCFTFGWATFLPCFPLGDQASGGASLCHATLTGGRTTTRNTAMEKTVRKGGCHEDNLLVRNVLEGMG